MLIPNLVHLDGDEAVVEAVGREVGGEPVEGRPQPPPPPPPPLLLTLLLPTTKLPPEVVVSQQVRKTSHFVHSPHLRMFNFFLFLCLGFVCKI